MSADTTTPATRRADAGTVRAGPRPFQGNGMTTTATDPDARPVRDRTGQGCGDGWRGW
jgi:hypothetical protein